MSTTSTSTLTELASKPTAASPGLIFLTATWALAARELVRFFRQRTRIVGALGQPFIFWVLFGAGLRGSFQAPEWAGATGAEMSYQEYFFPGVAVMIVMFTAIFSTISIIEDRREGFLQGVLVAPIPRAAIVAGKLTGGSLLAIIQAALFLMIGPLLSFVGLAPDFRLSLGPVDWILLIGFVTVMAYGLTALGYLLAWPMQSTQGFHAIMSVFLMPMWLLSGAFFPGETGWVSWIIRINPLSYGVAGLRQLLYPAADWSIQGGLPSLGMCATVTVGFAAICSLLCVRMTERRSVANVR